MARKRIGKKISPLDQRIAYWEAMYPDLTQQEQALVRDCCREKPEILDRAHANVRNAAGRAEFRQPGTTPKQQWMAIVTKDLDDFRLEEFRRKMERRAKEDQAAANRARKAQRPNYDA